MINVQIFPLIATAYTTIDLERPNLIKIINESLKELYRENDLLISYWDSKRAETKEITLSMISESELLHRTTYQHKEGLHGVFSVSDFNKKLFSASYEWKKYFRNRWDKLQKSGLLTQNSVALHFNTDQLDHAENRHRLIDFWKHIALSFKINYSIILNPKNDSRGMGGSLDYSTGLKNVYWLNIFGKPFVNIIGRERLINSPAWRTEELDSSMILVQTSDPFCDHGNLDCSIALRAIRNHIGEKYFYKLERNFKQKSGVISIFDFIKHLYGARKVLRDVRRYAELCPTFDWSQMISEDERK